VADALRLRGEAADEMTQCSNHPGGGDRFPQTAWR